MSSGKRRLMMTLAPVQAGLALVVMGHFDLHVNVDGTKINPSHKYQVHLTAYDQGDMTTSEDSYPVVVLEPYPYPGFSSVSSTVTSVPLAWYYLCIFI